MVVKSRKEETEQKEEYEGGWESKEAENLCNNRETNDSPSRKKMGKGSRGRRAKRALVPEQQRDELLSSSSSRLASRR